MADNKDTTEINWAETILLPKTDFPMRANLPDATSNPREMGSRRYLSSKQN